MNMLWSAQQAIEFLDAVANEDIDPRTMRDAIPAFLAAADGHTSFPLSPLLSFEFRRLTLSAALEIRDALARLLVRRLVGHGVTVERSNWTVCCTSRAKLTS